MNEIGGYERSRKSEADQFAYDITMNAPLLASRAEMDDYNKRLEDNRAKAYKLFRVIE